MPFIGNAKYGAEACDKVAMRKTIIKGVPNSLKLASTSKKWIIGSGGFVDDRQSRRFERKNCQPNHHRPWRF
jgi:hypothetical protein